MRSKFLSTFGLLLLLQAIQAGCANSQPTVRVSERRQLNSGPTNRGTDVKASANGGVIQVPDNGRNYPFPLNPNSRLNGVPLPFDDGDFARPDEQSGAAVSTLMAARGVYESACEGRIKRFLVVDGDIIVRASRLHSLQNCVSPVAEWAVAILAARVTQFGGTINSQSLIAAVSATPLTIEQANEDNSSGFCGIGNWQANKPVDIAGRICDGISMPLVEQPLNLTMQVTQNSFTSDGVFYSKMSTGFGITGGSPIDISSSILALSTVAFMIDNGPFCTGTLITPNHFVTAAHCVDGDTPSKLPSLFVGLGQRGENRLKVVSLKMHEQYDKTQKFPENGRGFTARAHNDIAIVKFSGTLPKPYRPIAILPSGESLKKDEKVYIAGYGRDERRQSGTLRSTFSLFDVDNIVSRLFRTISGVTQSTCNGDSGGPAYIARGGFYYLVGATSYGPSNFNCMSGDSLFVDLRKFTSWL